MAEVLVKEATYLDAVELAPRLRDHHLEEIQFWTDRTPLEVLKADLETAEFAWTLRVDGAVIAMGGVNPTSILSPVGIAWLYTSHAAERFPKTFCKVAREFFRRANSVFPTIRAAVDERCPMACRWADWMGLRTDRVVRRGAASFRQVTLAGEV